MFASLVSLTQTKGINNVVQCARPRKGGNLKQLCKPVKYKHNKE